MAERQDALPPEADDDATVDKPSPKRRLPKWLLLIPLVLLPAAGGAALALLKYETLVIGSAEARFRFAKADTKEDKPRNYGEFIKLQGMIINPAESEGKRFLMVDIGLESSSGAVLNEIESKDIVVRDAIIKVLGSRTVQELSSLDHRNAMKEDLIAAINSLLRRGEVEYIYFTQYVLQ
jgi:flagellar protein FliL